MARRIRWLRLFIFLLTGCISQNVFCRYSLAGKVLDSKTGEPIEYASIALAERGLWAISNEKGEFTINDVASGETEVAVFCLGYVKRIFPLTVTKNMEDLKFRLQADNLALKEVTVTAKRKDDDITTSYLIDRTSLEHLQMLNVADALSLLPGGQTNTTLHLASSTPQTITVRSRSGEDGNPAFGTAIEVDGVRLSNNTTDLFGVDTRNIATGNISSIEVVSGIPSVEYGDMTNGIVKINTRKGKSPWTVEMATKPNTKQLSANRGFALGKDAGILNASAEYTRSIADLASPYTSYERNGWSLAYSNTFNKKSGRLLSLETAIIGNIGGYNSQQDADITRNDYTLAKDNTVRGNVKANWLLRLPWITALEASAAIRYTDNLQIVNTFQDNSVARPILHGKEEGYFGSVWYDDNPAASVVLYIPPTGSWYQLRYTDSRPVDFTASLKAKWMRTFGKINHTALLGTDFSRSANNGKGVYYGDLRYASESGSNSWREYRYDRLPPMNNIAWYAEEKITLAMEKSNLQLSAGIRSDNTLIKNSIYGTVTGFSPRFNAKYTFRERRDKFIKQWSVRAGWGKSIKLPAFDVLFPRPYYSDVRLVSGSTGNDRAPFYAYYIQPFSAVYNPSLQWQYNQQTELGVEIKMKGAALSLSAYNNRVLNGYTQSTQYNSVTYNRASEADLYACPIVGTDRIYSVNQQTGVITISDKTGLLPDVVLPYAERKEFKSHTTYVNGSPTVRRGVEWILDFDKIPSLQTSFRLDGNYYYYRNTDETISAYSRPINGVDNTPFRYVGFYAGGYLASNGYTSKRLTTNATVTTHIPAIRIILSLRIEGTFYNFKQNLSEYNGEQHGFPLENKEDYFPSATSGSIYNSNRFVAVYPLYYAEHGDLENKIPYAQALADAYKNNKPLYDDLINLVIKTNTNYYFNASKVSGYYSANISITKEIGNIASISFNATNFTNNMQSVRTTENNALHSLYGSSYIPRFYYGLSLRLKWQ